MRSGYHEKNTKPEMGIAYNDREQKSGKARLTSKER